MNGICGNGREDIWTILTGLVIHIGPLVCMSNALHVMERGLRPMVVFVFIIFLVIAPDVQSDAFVK